jgi:hypothetical protein
VAQIDDALGDELRALVQLPVERVDSWLTLVGPQRVAEPESVNWWLGLAESAKGRLYYGHNIADDE